ncbi:PHD finger protein EHD3 isoform X2 [Manihot esculenta]|uniref:Uncharacterized protein n=2 Tax=Manihot esculenta TaxID=3983 RepID=A0ACB7I8D8_MANES|nr:PHD finger protein EHD3 isoform X2 [Manihot esculenta]KAG8660530.1 hypothetical protein MANES_02G169600v8 [Manihot esculenta]KAG8660531.1 hypothetical protein MANES_02G169600v8 [Manihot esculenta]
MGGGKGTSNDDDTGERVQCLKSEEVNNGFWIRIENSSADGGSESIKCFQTYKRRKHTRWSSESKGQEEGKGSVEAASKFAEQAKKEPTPNCVPEGHASSDGSDDVSHKQCRNVILECIHQSLNDEEGGIRGCIRDALMMPVKESDTCDEYGHKFSSQAREMKVDNLIGLSIMNARMKDGAYERSPSLFFTDIQLVWKKLQGIGNDLISLAKGLSDVSLTCYNEQFLTQGFDFHHKSEKIDSCGVYSVCTCWRCGGIADGRNCLVCDSCEEMYHVSCIEPAVKEIPPKSWYCASCKAVGIASPHEDCLVCERLNATRTNEKGSSTIERIVREFEENSNCTRDDFCQPPAGIKKVCVCNICGNEVENGEKLKICDHDLCPYKYYHMRCLTTNLLKSHGRHWYCPSCLCRVCLTDKDDSKIVLCDGCDNAYHLYCMSPLRTSVPRGKWFCRQCDVKIKKIRGVRQVYEEQGCRMKKKMEAAERACENIEKILDEKCEPESFEGRGSMDMLLTAALYEEKKCMTF